MQIYIEDNYDKLSKRAASLISSFIKEKPNCVLGLATGSTPQKIYGILGKMCKEKKISFKKIKTFNLDEYLGLDPKHPQSYRFFMEKNLFSKTDIDAKNTFFPTDFKANSYDKEIIKAGGIDLQILGIGQNGHIGFNEPGSAFSSKTRQVNLTQSTIQANARFFKNKNEVSKKAVTMGISTIMNAKKIILLASGANKKEAVFKAIFGKPTTKIPASVLQNHKNVIIILDKAAIGQ